MAVNSKSKPTWEEGDFVVVSSDGTRLLVDADHLMGARYVVCITVGTDSSTRLRDLVTAHSADREVVFTDPIEDSTTVALFLSILTEKRVCADALGSGVDVIDRLRRLFAFMKAHNCDIPRRTALASLHRDRRLKPYQRFAVGAGEGDLDLCVAALGTTVLDHALGRNHGDCDGRFDLDPRSMPFSIRRRIPPQHLWALTRAWDQSNPNITSRSGYHVDELVDLFESFFKIAQNAPPAPDYAPALDEVMRRNSQPRRQAL